MALPVAFDCVYNLILVVYLLQQTSMHSNVENKIDRRPQRPIISPIKPGISACSVKAAKKSPRKLIRPFIAHRYARIKAGRSLG